MYFCCVKNAVRTFGYRLRIFSLTVNRTCYNIPQFTNSYRLTISQVRPLSNLAYEVKHEKRTFSDLENLIKKGKQIHLRFITILLEDIKHIENLSEEQLVLLLEQCGEHIPVESTEARNNICQQIFVKLKDADKITTNILQKYITVCTQNKVLLNYSEVISLLKNEPDKETYKLLLANVCERGDINQALDLLNEMKGRNLAADEQTFNSLVLAQTIFGGLKDGETVMLTMKELQVPETINTVFSLYKGLATRNNVEEFEYCIQKYSIDLDSHQMISLIETFALNNNIAWLDKILPLFPKENFTKEFFHRLEQLCIFLIHMKRPSEALDIYTKLVIPSNRTRYAVSLFRQMLHSNTKVDEIITLAKQIRDRELNSNIFLDIVEIALKHKYSFSAWALYEHLPILRQHFFWPLLLDAQYREKEEGIMKTLTRMMDFKVPIDSETLEVYCLPFCDLDNVHVTVDKLKKLNLTVREVVAAMTQVLLRKGETKIAIDLNKRYNVQLNGERLLQILPHVWFGRKHDAQSVLYFVQRISESEAMGSYFLGEFLMKCLKLCQTSYDFRKYMQLLKDVSNKGLKINSDSADLLNNFLTYKCQDRKLHESLTIAVDNLMDLSLRLNLSPIVHPKNMNTDQLECHLVELKTKNMETRGLIRKLIQQYASVGNIDRVLELRMEFQVSGYKESPGMKASIMHTFIKAGSIEPALSTYNELRSQDKYFTLDSFKILDLAHLLVLEKRYSEAKMIIDKESKSQLIKGGPSNEKNCVRILNACDKESDQLEIFNLLVDRGFCKPTNILLGPLVRLHLKKNDLDKAVKFFCECVNTYKCTPLQLEVYCATLLANRKDLVQEIMEKTKEVHGPRAVDEVMFMALAETKLDKMLQNFLAAAMVIPENRLTNVCNKWIAEDKLDCLLVVVEAHKKASSKMFDIAKIHQAVMEIYSNRKDCEGAISFYEQLLEDEVLVDKETEKELNMLLEKCHYQIPKSLKNKMS